MAKPTIDSNATGLYLAEEASFREPKTAGIFRPLEPNSYDNFGANNEMTARNPINRSRQNQKGRVTNVTAQVGVTQDLTSDVAHLLQGFVFADAHYKTGTMNPFNDTVTPQVAVQSIQGGVVTFTNDTHPFVTGMIVKINGLDNGATNTGVVTGVDGAAVTVEGEIPDVTNVPAGVYVMMVGMTIDSLSIEVNNGVPNLVTQGSFEDLKLQPGEWIYIGNNQPDGGFSNVANGGFARVATVGDTVLELDKTDAPYTDEDASGVDVHVYVGVMIRNEKDPDLIKQRSYVAQRTYGQAGGEFVLGCRANQFQMTVPTNGKVTTQLSYVAATSQVYESESDPQYIKGNRLEQKRLPMYSTATDFYRMNLSVIRPVDEGLDQFVAHMSEFNVQIDNGVSAQNKIGTLGAFSTSSGNFAVSGSLTAFFTDVQAVRAVRQNADVTFDFAMVSNGVGYLFDMPQVNLGNGAVNVQQDNPITLPLDTSASEGKFGSTLNVMYFPHLPEMV